MARHILFVNRHLIGYSATGMGRVTDSTNSVINWLASSVRELQKKVKELETEKKKEKVSVRELQKKVKELENEEVKGKASLACIQNTLNADFGTKLDTVLKLVSDYLADVRELQKKVQELETEKAKEKENLECILNKLHVGFGTKLDAMVKLASESLADVRELQMKMKKLETETEKEKEKGQSCSVKKEGKKVRWSMAAPEVLCVGREDAQADCVGIGFRDRGHYGTGYAGYGCKSRGHDCADSVGNRAAAVGNKGAQHGTADRTQVLPDRCYLEVPTMKENFEVKALGALWDAKAKRWYVHWHCDLEDFEKWIPRSVLQQIKELRGPQH